MNKIQILVLLATVIALLVCAMATAVNSKHKKSTSRKTQSCRWASSFMIGLQEALVYPANLWRQFRYRQKIIYGANVGGGTHKHSLTRKVDAAVATTYLLAKVGSDTDHVNIAGAADEPIGVMIDQAAAAEDIIGIELLGITDRTVTMVASEAIAVGALVYTADGGKIQDSPVVAGTYWLVGKAIRAAAADGEEIEVQHIKPIRVVVIAALTSVQNATAAAVDLATAEALANALKANYNALQADVAAIGAALATPALVKILT
jgi:hypothetical protein